MSGRSNLSKQREERMVEKRRSMPGPNGVRSPSSQQRPVEKPIEEEKTSDLITTDVIRPSLIVAVN